MTDSTTQTVIATSKAFSATIAVAVVTILVWANNQFLGVSIPDYVQGAMTVIAAALGDKLFPNS